jgi:hypothetical protein
MKASKLIGGPSAGKSLKPGRKGWLQRMSKMKGAIAVDGWLVDLLLFGGVVGVVSVVSVV